MIKKIFYFFTVIILINITLINCNDGDKTTACFPDSTINATINLTLPEYKDLLVPAGSAYVNQTLAGTRGLIVVNTGQGFKAYDRNAPHLCPGENTTLEVRNAISLYCPADGATWILSTGQPVGEKGNSPVTGMSPKTYNVIPSGNMLYITN